MASLVEGALFVKLSYKNKWNAFAAVREFRHRKSLRRGPMSTKECLTWLCLSVLLSTTHIPIGVLDAVEDEQQFENALTALTACSECKDDAVFAKEESLNNYTGAFRV
ncbi:hypothetical protein TNCT_622081 [Trichonephila clavata]|uniref:Uncharacterized protein n=1 Tax=Trichonephila clavata TaxID=2740835 RepID=A0A8X6FPY5_TRICU|nr:hypothetical protein TNCT_622081 [Trichonephila clavata]